MPLPTTPSTKSGIQTSTDGTSYIPSSLRPDGSTRKEIRVRPGYRPPEDVETYKNRVAEAWKNRGKGGVPGAEGMTGFRDDVSDLPKNKNARRREAAKKKAKENGDNCLIDGDEDGLCMAMKQHSVAVEKAATELWRDPANLSTNTTAAEVEKSEHQKKARNLLKKLNAVRELKAKRDAGEKLSPDQLAKLLKEAELIRDLLKTGYDGPALESISAQTTTRATNG